MTDVMFMWPEWLIDSPLIYATLLYHLFPHISPFSLSYFSRLLFPTLLINQCFSRSLPSSVSVFVVERREIHDDTAGWDAAWHRCGDEVPVRHELCSQRPRCPEYPGQQQLGLQGLWLWPVTLSGWHLRWPHLHELPGQYYACLLFSALCLYTLCMSNRAC